MTYLDEIKKRTEAATPGPWHMRHRSPPEVVIETEPNTGNICLSYDEPRQMDATFIAHARTDLPWLVKWANRAAMEMDGLAASISMWSIIKDSEDVTEEMMRAHDRLMEIIAELDDGPSATQSASRGKEGE